MLGNLTGVTIGMTHIQVPLMVLPLFATLVRIDRRLLTAAVSLGAHPVSAFLRVYLPLSMPGASPARSWSSFILLDLSDACFAGLAAAVAAVATDRHADTACAGMGPRRAMALVLFGSTVLVLGLRVPAHAPVRYRACRREALMGPMDRAPKWLSLFSGMVAAWLFLPSLVVLPMSLNATNRLSVWPQARSLRLYTSFFTNEMWYSATLRSVGIAITVSICATLLGGAAAFAIDRGSRGPRICSTRSCWRR